MKTMMRITSALLLCLGLLPLASEAADVTLMPVNVKLDSANDRATVQVANNGTEPVVMQAEAIAWTRVNGVDVDGATTDIIVNPPVFTVKPGQTQVVRVGLRRNQELQQEGTYRIVLREVPTLRMSDIGNVSGSVRVLMALRVPVYVAPAKVVRNEKWKLSKDSNGEMTAVVSNAGNVHMKIAELRLQGAGTEDLVIEQRGSHAVIFPGEERSFRLKRVISTQPVNLQVRTDEGLQNVAFNGDQP